MSRLERDVPVTPRVTRAPRAKSPDASDTGAGVPSPNAAPGRTPGNGARNQPPLDATAVLSVLNAAVALVSTEGMVLHINHAWEHAFGCTFDECARRELFACFPALARATVVDAIRATVADRTTRYTTVELMERADPTIYEMRVARAGDVAVLELVRAEHPAAEGTGQPERPAGIQALRTLVRQMAEATDGSALLSLLCTAASEQCAATGAAVLRARDGRAHVVASSGVLGPLDGAEGAFERSILADVSRGRAIVTDDGTIAGHDIFPRDVFASGSAPCFGPVIAAPLRAHETPLGALVLVRSAGTSPFSAEEMTRLQVIADHAALAMWKSDLLEQAQSADRAKGRFLATVSHELRTPLTALTGYEELLADEVIGPLTAAQTDIVERMRSVTNHLTVMIEEVLAYSSIEAGRDAVRVSDFLVADLVRAAVAVVEPIARQKRLRLLCTLPEQAVRLTSDVDKLRQILVNLLGNAAKFTDGGEVEIALAVADRTVRIAVRDTGVGISPDDQRRLFRPFGQVDAGLTRRHGGTGLGLYISQRLAQLLGGRIEVESTPGSGSTFTLVVPR